MATSGALNTTAWSGSYGNRYLELKWERQSIAVFEQTTTIKWTLTGKGSYSGYVMAAPFIVEIDGKTVYNSESRIKLYANQEVASGTTTIKHNTDGTKTFSISVKAAIYSSAINVSGSGTYTLDLVGMATISVAPDFTDEDNPTIKYVNPVGSAISKLQACISLTGEHAEVEYREIPIAGGSYTFNFTDAERKVLRAATTGSNSRIVKFYLRSTINGTNYHTHNDVKFTVINAQPTLTVSVIDANSTTKALTGVNTTLIRNHSTAYATLTATAKKEATIAATRIDGGGKTAASTILSVANVGSNVFNFSATDSRGNIAEKTYTAQMVDYITPTCNINSDSQMPTTGSYTIKCGGNYFNDTFGFTSAAAANTLTVKYRYKEQGGSYSSWASMTATKSGNTYTATATKSGLDYRKTYVFQCQTADKLNTITTAEFTVKSLPVFHWSENDFVFEVPVVFNAGTEGTTPTEAAAIEYGEWTPYFYSSFVSSYTIQRGWYQKVGNIVSIGWNVKAEMNTGFSGAIVDIRGCPYTPIENAFGGGVAHNIYLSAGFCFEGWCIGTDGLITGRAQPCNNTAAGNLNITSAVCYPSGTSKSVMTLAGSITFMINE